MNDAQDRPTVRADEPNEIEDTPGAILPVDIRDEILVGTFALLTGRLADPLAPTDLGFGLARMYELLSDGTPEQIDVSATWTRPNGWVGLRL